MLTRNRIIALAGAGIAVALLAATTRPSTAADVAPNDIEQSAQPAEQQQQRRPTMCEAVAIRAQTLIEANLPLPRNLRGKTGPAVNMACEEFRSRDLR